MAWFRRLRRSGPPDPLLTASAGTATDRYQVMLKEVVGPRLRELGFRGSRGVYTRPDPDHFVRIGFQKSTYGTRDDVSFTLNVSAVDKAGWERARAEQPHLPVEPAANTFYGTAHWQRRITALLPDRDCDLWWELVAASDVAAVGSDVLAVIEEFALPAIERVVTGNA